MFKLVNIGSKKIEVCIRGEGHPVLIVPGLATSMDEWETVINKLASKVKVIGFHRAGYGKSEIGKEKPNTQSTAKDISSVLDALHIHQPITLVGHSYGGFCVQRFAQEFPEKVQAMVLVESNSMNFERLQKVMGNDMSNWRDHYKTLAQMDKKNLKKSIPLQLTPDQQKLSEKAQSRILEFKQNPKMYKVMLQELEEMPNGASTMKKNLHPSHKPLIVIGRDPQKSIQMMVELGKSQQQAENIENIWQNLIKEQLTLSTNSRYVRATNSSHGVYFDTPQVIVDEILKLVNSDEGQVKI